MGKVMTTIDHQQAAVRVAAEVIAPHAYDKALWRCTLADGRSMEQTASDAEVTAREVLAAATPHLRAAWEAELLGEGVLGAGYSVLMNPKAGEHPVATFTRAVRHMLALLEGGGE